MIENKWLGDKTKQGFYKKTKSAEGKTEILELDLKSLEYKPSAKIKFKTLESTKTVDDLKQRLPMLLGGTDEAAAFYRFMFFSLFSYVSHRIPEIADEIYKIDDAMCAGFGWEIGPFETWDILGVQSVVTQMQKEGYSVAPWVTEMISNGINSFYNIDNGKKSYFDLQTKKLNPLLAKEV